MLTPPWEVGSEGPEERAYRDASDRLEKACSPMPTFTHECGWLSELFRGKGEEVEALASPSFVLGREK